MRLASKFATSLTVALALVLGAQSWWQVRSVARLFEREMRDDVAILGHTLAASLSDAWSLSGPSAARELLGRLGPEREHVSLRLLETAELGTAAEGLRVEGSGNAEIWKIIAYYPVESHGTRVGLLRVDRRFSEERSHLRSLLLTQVITTALAVLLTFFVALLVGALLISRPIRRLSLLAHRVAEGDFSVRTDAVGSGDLARLGRELDAMTERLAASQENVREERRARTEALAQLRHADRLSLLGKLASIMAHELGTPLNVVSGRATMISRDERVVASGRENADIILEQTRRMAAIIRELLDFAGRKPLDRRPASVRDVLEHAAALMEPMCDDRDVSLQVVQGPEAVAEIDRGKTLQVVTNLIMNAIHAMPDGGVIQLRASREHVTDPPDRHASAGDFVRIDVIDEGVGIPEERRREIFQPFFTTKGGRGTGLGLSVCHGIVREHGGFIELDSRVGVGTRFSVYLPEREGS